MTHNPLLSRDARHLALDAVGAEGQAGIAAGSVLLIGVGGIGCAAAQYLVAAGVGRVAMTDFDTVDATNLGRQVLYGDADVGKSKVAVAAERLAALNSENNVVAIDKRLSGDALDAAVSDVDIVLDGSDNFATRFAVNDACVRAGKRLVSGAAIRMEGQLCVFGPDYSTSPCYRCLYTEADETLESCAGNGVLGPVPGVIGTLMAVEALKTFAGLDVATGRLRLYDAVRTEFQSLNIRKRDNCSECQ
ncbi:MAG: HesA/MoeB/ThiF family protein [Woeseiaceae bacterium]|nr:HesA/MoeB/ThiF family protein [Woeseiaceae bacterium]